MHRHIPAFRRRDHGIQRSGIFGAEIEDLPDFNAPAFLQVFLRHRRFARNVLLVGRGIERRIALDDAVHLVHVRVIHVHVGEVLIFPGLIIEHPALTGIGEDDELMGEIAADRAGIGLHRNGAQAHAGVGLQVGDEHLVVGIHRAFIGRVEGIVILHQELTPPHHAEPGPHLVPELPLDVIEHQWQRLVAAHMGPEDIGDQLLIGRTIEHVAPVPVLDPQHFLAVIVVPAAFAPEIG